MKLYYGPQLLIDAKSPKFSRSQIKQILSELCDEVKMHSISEVETVKGADYNPGISGNVFIEFSNICIHTFDREDYAGFNLCLFSCKNFSVSKVIRYLKKKGVYDIDARRVWREIK